MSAHRERTRHGTVQQAVIACRYNMKQPTMAKLFLDVLQVRSTTHHVLS